MPLVLRDPVTARLSRLEPIGRGQLRIITLGRRRIARIRPDLRRWAFEILVAASILSFIGRWPVGLVVVSLVLATVTGLATLVHEPKAVAGRAPTV